MEITCPQCGTVITVDDAAINEKAVNREVERRLAALKRVQEAEAAAQAAKEAEQAARDAARHREELSGKDREIERLNQMLAGWEEKKTLEMKALEERLAGWEKAKQLEIEAAKLQAKEAAAGELREMSEKISDLIAEASKKKDLADQRLEGVMEAHKKEVEALEKEIELYKSFKLKRSVKLLGEDLEQHCYALYNQYLLPVMPESSFKKDNDAVKEEGEEKGSKGDFIFRGKENGTEFVSIMFEMKNEGESSSNRQKNSEFFEKLDKDRRKKGCEFAVLVSMLEMDNDFYNNGITVVPGYDKMYVVRPDNFLPIITLLVQTSRNSVETKKELEAAKSQSLDITHFEEKVLAFRDGFTRNMADAKKKYDDAIKGIDNAIKTLTNIKEALRISSGHLDKAGGKVEDFTLKRLTRGNPTLTRLIDEARRKKAVAEEESGPEDQ